MAFTSTYYEAGTIGTHIVTVRAKSTTKSRQLYRRIRGKVFKRYKGDIWTYQFSDFGFPYSCIKIGDIESVAIDAHSSDGWNIGSIVTLVGDTEGGNGLLTTDFGVNRWVDTGKHKHFELTRYS